MNSAQAIKQLPIFTADGVPIPLLQVAKIDLVDGQTLIARENGNRRITVRTDIVGRDQNGFVRDAQATFAATFGPLPPGYRVNWIGMFDNLEHAIRHFEIVLPITVILLMGMLLITFRSVKAALLLLLSLPFALIGGVVALRFRGMNCLRPILLASLVAILGLLPASLATGLGSDVQRPLATVIVWGLLSSTILTLFVVPVLYDLFNPGVPASDEMPREALVS